MAVQEFLGILLSVLLLVLSYILLHSRKPRVTYPAGPQPRPFIGNALDIPIRKPWVKYLEWSKLFNSSVIHLSVFNLHIVAINTVDEAFELLDKRSTNFSNRPSIPLLKFLGMHRITPFTPYGNTWKKHRRILDENLRKDRAPCHDYIYEQKAHITLGLLLNEPLQFRDHCLTFIVSIIMAVAFGYDVIPGQKDDFVDLVQSSIDIARELLLPGRTLIAVFSFLGYIPTWFPWTTTQRLCAKAREGIQQFRDIPFRYVEENLQSRSEDCILPRLLESRSRSEGSYGDDEVLKDVMSTLYMAAVDTIKSTLWVFILAMAIYPDVQKKAQDEIDKLVGSERLPTFKDRPSLPYIEALYREVLRWKPVFPVGVPHTSLSDDEYQGSTIPKGSYVFPNAWGMSRDELKYPNPELFSPERFFNADGTLNDDTVHFAFGFGRRICPGRFMVERVVWFFMVSVLAGFRISKARDENGNEIDLDPDAFVDGLANEPLPFKCSIVPRSPQAESLIRDVASTAQQNLKPA